MGRPQGSLATATSSRDSITVYNTSPRQEALGHSETIGVIYRVGSSEEESDPVTDPEWTSEESESGLNGRDSDEGTHEGEKMEEGVQEEGVQEEGDQEEEGEEEEETMNCDPDRAEPHRGVKRQRRGCRSAKS